MSRFPTWAVLAVWIAGAAGCGGADEFPETDDAGTAGAEGFEGLSPEEIRARAEPMSPEVAESLGIVDTTIHIDDPIREDTVVPPRMTPDPGDTIPPN